MCTEEGDVQMCTPASKKRVGEQKGKQDVRFQQDATAGEACIAFETGIYVLFRTFSKEPTGHLVGITRQRSKCLVKRGRRDGKCFQPSALSRLFSLGLPPLLFFSRAHRLSETLHGVSSKGAQGEGRLAHSLDNRKSESRRRRHRHGHRRHLTFDFFSCSSSTEKGGRRTKIPEAVSSRTDCILNAQ